MMGNISKFIEAEGERKKVQEEMRPLEERHRELSRIIEDVDTNLTFSEREFINQKLWENLSEKHQQDVLDSRAELEKMLSGNYSYYQTNDPFDPFRDKWHLITYKRLDDGRIQLEVSCKRREGTISGLMTFLDTYWTVPFNKNEMGVD